MEKHFIHFVVGSNIIRVSKVKTLYSERIGGPETVKEILDIGNIEVLTWDNENSYHWEKNDISEHIAENDDILNYKKFNSEAAALREIGIILLNGELIHKKEKTREEQAIASLKWVIFNLGEDTKPHTFENAVKVYCQNAVSVIEDSEKNAKFAHLVKDKHVDLMAFHFKDMTAEKYNKFWAKGGQELLNDDDVAFIHDFMGEQPTRVDPKKW